MVDEHICRHTLCEYHGVVSSGLVTDEYCDKRPLDWTTQDVKTFEEATKSYMVEVIEGYHFGSSN
jgi:hypothetical protein